MLLDISLWYRLLKIYNNFFRYVIIITIQNLVNNLPEEIHKINSKYEHDDKKCEICEIKYKDCDCFLEYANFKDNLIE